MISEMCLTDDADQDPVQNPSWVAIERAINELDGSARTGLILRMDSPDRHMGIAGGPDLFLAYVTWDNRRFHNLINAAGSVRKVELAAAGQITEVSERQCVNRWAVIEAARTLFQSEKLAESVSWETT